jgi:hypothetical protein
MTESGSVSAAVVTGAGSLRDQKIVIFIVIVIVVGEVQEHQ